MAKVTKKNDTKKRTGTKTKKSVKKDINIEETMADMKKLALQDDDTVEDADKQKDATISENDVKELTDPYPVEINETSAEDDTLVEIDEANKPTVTEVAEEVSNDAEINETLEDDTLVENNETDECYNGIFNGCSSMTTAPELSTNETTVTEAAEEVSNDVETNKAPEDNTIAEIDEATQIPVTEGVEENNKNKKKENKPKRRSYQEVFGHTWMGYGFSE